MDSSNSASVYVLSHFYLRGNYCMRSHNLQHISLLHSWLYNSTLMHLMFTCVFVYLFFHPMPVSLPHYTQSIFIYIYACNI